MASDLKFLKEAQDQMLAHITLLCDNLSNVVKDFNGNIKENILKFTKDIELKQKKDEDKFNVQKSDLDRVKSELSNKKFEEKNFTNVSMLKKQDKQISEKDNKIRELESKLKYMEKEMNTFKQQALEVHVKVPINNIDQQEISDIINSVADKTPTEIEDIDNNTTSIQKKSKGKIQKKDIVEEKPIPVVNIPEEIVEETVNKSKVKITRAKKLTKAEQDLENERIRLEREAEEEERIRIAQEAVRLSNRVDQEAERLRLEREIENDIEEDVNDDDENITIDEDCDNTDDAGNADAELEEQRLLEEEAERLQKEAEAEAEAERLRIEAEAEEAAKKNKKTIKKVEPKKVEIIKKNDKKTVKETPVAVQQSDKDDDNMVVKYPDQIPSSVEDVETLEYNSELLYIDKQNNVYQITDDDDIGIFLGVYNHKTKIIMTI
jgi:hypothetical protein